MSPYRSSNEPLYVTEPGRFLLRDFFTPAAPFLCEVCIKERIEIASPSNLT
jgi:hypothetical protein